MADTVLLLSLSSFHLPLQCSHLCLPLQPWALGGVKPCKSLVRYQRLCWVVNLGPGRLKDGKKERTVLGYWVSWVLQYWWSKIWNSLTSQTHNTQAVLALESCILKMPERWWYKAAHSNCKRIVFSVNKVALQCFCSLLEFWSGQARNSTRKLAPKLSFP